MTPDVFLATAWQRWGRLPDRELAECTEPEREAVRQLEAQAILMEFAALSDLVGNCHSRWQFAKTYQVLRADLLNTLSQPGNPNAPPHVNQAVKAAMELVGQQKLAAMAGWFEVHFADAHDRRQVQAGRVRWAIEVYDRAILTGRGQTLPSETQAMPLIEDLERLAALRQDGVLTDEEFTEAKRKLIGGTTSPVVPQPVVPTGGGQSVLPPPPVPRAEAPPALENNPEAIVGFVTGLLSMVLYFLGIVPVVAVVFSLIALNTFDERRHKNKWMAVTGLVLGVVYCVVSLNHFGHLK